MKITFFSSPILEHGGGTEQYYIDSTAWLARNEPDLEIQVITLGDKMFERLLNMLSIYYVRNLHKDKQYRETSEDVVRRLGKVKYIKCNSVKELKSILKNSDLIYSRNELIELVFVKFFGYKSLPPVIVGIHTPIFYPHIKTYYEWLHNKIYLSLFYKHLLNGAAAIKVANSDDQKLISSKFKFDNVIMVHHSIDIPVTDLNIIEDGVFKIVYIGRLVEQKGVKLLIKCLEQLSKHPDFHKMEVTIAGDGDKELIEDLKNLDTTHSNINYLGYVKKQDVGKLFKNADIVLVPSQYETVNQVALEAGAYGKVVIASDIPGPREIIINNETGVLIEPTIENFYRAILRLKAMKEDAPNEFMSLGKAARQRIIKEFSPKKEFGDLVCLFRKLKPGN